MDDDSRLSGTFDSAGVPASLLEYLHACAICSGRDLRHYCRVPSLFNENEFIHYERCAACGIVLRNPRLPQEYRESRYAEKGISEALTRLEPRNQLHYAYMMRLIRKLVKPGSGQRLLDFGCGNGGFLLEGQKAGFDVMGLELNRGLAKHVETTYGIPVFQGLVTDPEFVQERFDVIISSQVFEHLVDPRSTLEQLRKHLVSPGLLLIEVPNLLHIRERLRRGAIMDDSHLFYFSARSLSGLLARTGFRVVKVQQGLRPYRILSGYTNRAPHWVHDLGQGVLSALQVKTGLSVIASLD